MKKESTFKLDEDIEFARVKQFASQVKNLPHGLVSDFEKDFSGEHSSLT